MSAAEAAGRRAAKLFENLVALAATGEPLPEGQGAHVASPAVVAPAGPNSPAAHAVPPMHEPMPSLVQPLPLWRPEGQFAQALRSISPSQSGSSCVSYCPAPHPLYPYHVQPFQ